MKQINNEDESHVLLMEFKDQYNEFFVPNSVTYKVYNVTEETVRVTSTPLTPAKTIELSLTGDMVTMVDSTNNKELVRICVTVIDDDTNTWVRCSTYELIPATECDCG